MRLSAAILLGSTLHKQSFGHLVEWGMVSDGPKQKIVILKTCAIGAALAACNSGMNIDIDSGQKIGDLWPWADKSFTFCPECHGCFVVTYVVAHLNDYHLWTREEIAEWVAKIEPKDETRPEAVCHDNTEIETVSSAR